MYDARGHARSVAPGERPPTTHRNVSSPTSARALDRAGAERAVVGGLSMGAGVALRFALAHPERVQGLVLASFPAAARERGGHRGAGGRVRAARSTRKALLAAGERFVWGEGSGLSARDAALVRQGFLEHRPQALAHVLRELIAVQPAVEELAPQLAAPRPARADRGGRDRHAVGRHLAGAGGPGFRPPNILFGANITGSLLSMLSAKS